MTARHIKNPDLIRLAEATSFGMHMYFQGARRSGRTTEMLERLTPEHRVVVSTEAFARWLRDELRRKGLKNPVVVSPPQGPMYGPRSGAMVHGSQPTMPDHTWFEDRFNVLFNELLSQLQFELDQVDCPVKGEGHQMPMAKSARWAL